AIGNRTIGTAAVGGMVIGTIVGVIVIPGLVVLFSSRKNKGIKQNKKGLKEATVAVVALLFISSCSVPKQTSNPEIESKLATDAQQALKDTSSLADLPWRDVFTDANLIALIDSALLNNKDLKQAVLRIEKAQANFRFRKASLYPSVDAAVE